VTVAALVLGGLAAVVLAVAVATKDPQPSKLHGAASAQAAQSQAPLVAPAPSGEIEVPAELLYPVEAAAPSEP
jgi:hypothetical protein